MGVSQILENLGGGSVLRDRTRWSGADGLPTLQGTLADLRPLREGDAHALASLLVGEELTRFLAEPPATVEAFERFIARFNQEAGEGAAFVYAIVPRGLDVPVGLIQVRRLDPAFETAEWGFVLGSAFWGTGLFVDAATTLLDFVFGEVGARRLEARCVVRNGRAHGALRKLGAAQEGVLRQAQRLRDQIHDQAVWAILADDWHAARRARPALRVH